MEIIRIHTRTNNVDNRVHGLFCSHIRINDRPEFERWLLTQIYSICKNGGPAKWVCIMPMNVKHTSFENVRTDNVEVRPTWKKYMYRRVCITYCNHIRRQWGSQLGRIVRSMNRKCQGEGAYKSGNHTAKSLWDRVAEWKPWTWYTRYVETLKPAKVVSYRVALEGFKATPVGN